MNQFIERDFSCCRDHFTIRGNEFLPNGSNSNLPAIIVSHGFGGNSNDLKNYCETFASWGYAAYCFDFCGGCAYDKGKSDGGSTDMTILTECDDLIAVIEYVKSLSYIDSGKLTLLGFSQGGFVSALTAAKCAQDIDKLILMCPALCIPDDARNGALANSSYDINNVPEIIDCGAMLLGRNYHETVVHMDPYEEIASFGGAVLLIQGMKDSVVDYHYALKARKAYQPDQCQLQLVKDAGHGFDELQTKSVLASIEQFLLNKKEVLTIQVAITGHEIRKEDVDFKQIAVLFSGECATPYFTGRILSGAEDIQEYYRDQLQSMRAEYVLEGMDYKGERSKIHIINQNVNGQWKPVITTDSHALSFLNCSNLTAVLEEYSGGLTVRIYSNI